MTLVFSPAQAILAAETGAYCVSPFLGRLDDVGADGMEVLRSICDIYAVQGYETKVLAASLRHPMHVVESALAGADIATMPYDVFTKLVKHPLTDLGLERSRPIGERSSTELEGRGIHLMDTTMDRDTLGGKLLPELQQIAQTMGVEGTQRLRKAGLIDAIVAAGSNGGRRGEARPCQAHREAHRRRRHPSERRGGDGSRGRRVGDHGRRRRASPAAGARRPPERRAG